LILLLFSLLFSINISFNLCQGPVSNCRLRAPNSSMLCAEIFCLLMSIHGISCLIASWGVTHRTWFHTTIQTSRNCRVLFNVVKTLASGTGNIFQKCQSDLINSWWWDAFPRY
jgi:hypothetical protein